MKPGVIYYIRCTANGRVYVGSTTKAKPRQRWLEHLHGLRKGKHHSQHLQRAYDKHGEPAFLFEVVEQVADGSLLLVREQAHIDQHRAAVMNSAPVADGHLAAAAVNRGRVMGPEERARRSAAQTGIVRGAWSPERRAAHSIRLTGRKMPPMAEATKAAIAASNRGKKRRPEVVAAMLASRRKALMKRLEPCRPMLAAGLSLRAVEKATGVCRKVLARELT